MSKGVQKKALPQRLSGLEMWQLVLLLLVIVGGGVIFIGAMAGWFDEKRVVLSEEMYCGSGCEDYLLDIDVSRYNELIETKKSFIMLVDQGGCKTADKLRGFVEDYAREVGVMVYRIMFDEMRETSLHDYVKYYPSVVVVSRGMPVAWLRADKDEDADEYNNYEVFKLWIQKYLEISRNISRYTNNN